MQQLTVTDIEARVRRLLPHLQAVQQGTVACHRALQFRSGEHIQLRFRLHQGGLSDEQYEHLAAMICGHFSGDSIGVQFDFAMSVIVPEATALLLSETCEISYSDALKYMEGILQKDIKNWKGGYVCMILLPNL